MMVFALSGVGMMVFALSGVGKMQVIASGVGIMLVTASGVEMFVFASWIGLIVSGFRLVLVILVLDLNICLNRTTGLKYHTASLLYFVYYC